MVRRNMIELAKAHQIDLDQLQWYAAFHNTTHHPHIHLLVYAYLPKEVKQTVAELAKGEGILGLYKEWNKINREKLSLYREKKEPDLPLKDNPEFRSIKNKIIKAVLELPLPEDYDFDNEADLHATEEELKYAAQAEKQGEHFYPLHDGSVTEVPQVTEGTENRGTAYAALYHTEFVFAKDHSSGVKVPACIPSALIGLVSALAGMIGESQHRRLSKLRTQVDHKLRSKIEEKKRAHGLKTDGSLQEYDPEQSM